MRGSVTAARRSRGRGERHVDRVHDPARAGRLITATRSERNSASSTSWVTSSTVRGSCPSASASHCCISARVMASSAANGSSSSSTGRPGSRVRMNATRWRMPPESAGRAAGLEVLQPEALEQRRRLRRAPRLPGTPWHSSASAALPSASRHGQQQVALGHVGGLALDVARCPRPGAAGRRRARAGSTCRSRRGRPRRAPRRGGRPGRARSSAVTSPKRRVTPSISICASETSRGSITGAAPVCISLPSRALPRQVPRV